MDKFGIFKLFNSLLTANGQNNTPTGEKNTPAVNDFISSLQSVLGGDSNSNNPPLEKTVALPKANATREKAPPLQAEMLSTMRSHDEFVKRVKSGVKQ